MLESLFVVTLQALSAIFDVPLACLPEMLIDVASAIDK